MKTRYGGKNLPYCPECGSEVEEDANFCSECGYKMGDKETSPAKRERSESSSGIKVDWFEKRFSNDSRYCKNCEQMVTPQNQSVDWLGMALILFFLILNLSTEFRLLMVEVLENSIGTGYYYPMIALLILLLFFIPIKPQFTSKICPMCNDSNWDWSKTNRQDSKRSSGGL